MQALQEECVIHIRVAGRKMMGRGGGERRREKGGGSPD